MSIPVTGVSELVLEVVDLEAAERFYSALLGLPVVERWPDREAIWVMAGDRTRIGLWRPQVGLAGGRGGVHVHFAIHIADADYDSAVALLRERGQEIEETGVRRRGPCRLRDRPGWQRGRAVDLGRQRAPGLEHRLAPALVTAVFALLVLPVAAHAAAVSVEGDVLRVAAAPGEGNRLTVAAAPAAPDPAAGSFTVTDWARRSRPDPAARCPGTAARAARRLPALLRHPHRGGRRRPRRLGERHSSAPGADSGRRR